MSETGDLLAETGMSTAPVEEFFPRLYLRNRHLQTLVANFCHDTMRCRRRRRTSLKWMRADAAIAAGRREPTTSAGRRALKRRRRSVHAAQVTCCAIAIGNQSQPTTHYSAGPRPGRLLTVALYVGQLARAWAAGCNVIRMNMRNCGGTENLSPTLYHSGLSGDVAAVMRTLAAEKGLGAFALVGYSMGGNLVLKLAGELGKTAPQSLKAVVGVSPAMDLAPSADALHNASNRVYEGNFSLVCGGLSAKGGAVSGNLLDPWPG